MDQSPTIFVVDSDPYAQKLISNIARLVNCPCEGYPSGEEFLEGVSDARSGCLVSELQLPGMSGFHLQEKIATQEVPLPVVFVTSHANVSFAVRAMRAGALHFLEKPVPEKDLWEAIEEGLRLDRSNRQSMERRKAFAAKVASLTSQERQLLYLLTSGKPRKAIAKEMKVCVRTVEMWVARVKEKADVTTLAGLLHFALAANGQLEELDVEGAA